MAELEIDGTPEEQHAIMRATLKQHHSILFGNGQPGVVDFVSQIKGSLRLLVVLVSVVGVIVAILAFLEGNRQLHSKFATTDTSTVAQYESAQE